MTGMTAKFAALFIALSTAPPAEAQTARRALFTANELFHFLGTEPFWGGEVRGRRMVVTTPDNEKGEVIAVRRAVARRSVSFRGRMKDGAFTMSVRRASCSDGMSDRTYPFDVTVKFASFTWRGCGWTARQGFRLMPGETD